MLIKKILEALPLSPEPKRLPKQADFCAGAAVHHAGSCSTAFSLTAGTILPASSAPSAPLQSPVGLSAILPKVMSTLCPTILLQVPRVSRRWRECWAALQMRESQASFREIRAVAAQRSADPEDLLRLCALRLDGESLLLLERIAHFNAIGRALRYVRAQKEASTGRMRRNKLPYFLRLYRDYLDMAQGLKSDMSQRAILEPRDLKECHDLLAARVNELKSRPDNERFQRAIDQGLYEWAREYANEDYCVVYPMKRSDLTTEGQCLNHCVGGQAYFERHIRGHQMVFFIRKLSAPDKPYFTAEIDTDTGRIVHLYGFGDCSAPKEVRGFTEGFARNVVKWHTQVE